MSKKRHKFWNLLGGGGGGKNKNSSSTNKQKSATLGREKERKKDKKDLGRDSEERHRWSTGLPKLSPLPANVSKEKLCQLLDAKLNDSQLFLEFERIPKRKENGQYTCALLEENYSKNSDPTCLPMDENRVKLIPTRENRIGYVNASYVSVSKFICA
jgi:tyrosine-protein phosphatase non-receptor type 14/21